MKKYCIIVVILITSTLCLIKADDINKKNIIANGIEVKTQVIEVRDPEAESLGMYQNWEYTITDNGNLSYTEYWFGIIHVQVVEGTCTYRRDCVVNSRSDGERCPAQGISEVNTTYLPAGTPVGWYCGQMRIDH